MKTKQINGIVLPLQWVRLHPFWYGYDLAFGDVEQFPKQSIVSRQFAAQLLEGVGYAKARQTFGMN